MFHVYSDPNMTFFSKKHLPFAVLSILIFLLAVFPVPLILVFYPIKSFRNLLFKCPVGSRAITAINIFVQKFYSCYRDKIEGGRDMRSLVSIYFFLRLLVSLVTINQIPASVSFSLLVFIYTASSTLIALTQPYKRKYMTIIDTLILANLATLSHILSQLSGELAKPSVNMFFSAIGGIFAALPLLGLIGIAIYKMSRKFVNLPCCKRLLYSYQQLRNMEDYDRDLTFLASREDPEFQEYTVSVKEQSYEEKQFGSMYKHI